jgi:hypothetical protein
MDFTTFVHFLELIKLQECLHQGQTDPGTLTSGPGDHVSAMLTRSTWPRPGHVDLLVCGQPETNGGGGGRAGVRGHTRWTRMAAGSQRRAARDQMVTRIAGGE